MKRNLTLLSGSIIAATWIASGTVTAAESPNIVHPEVSGPGVSRGGSQSERNAPDGTPLPKGSPYSGTVEKGSSNSSWNSNSNSSSSQNVREAQQALKDKGFDPGAIDGVMGSRTKEAIKSFQSASGLETTGALNRETAQKLGIKSGSASDTKRNNPQRESSQQR
jgi:peptidoglycan hydrolase-like protein with peptidoglycan-binding domain